jgi:hypothetical protein
MKYKLLAPCGMDCSACSFYLAYLNGIPKQRGSISHCIGCRPRNKQCAYLKGQCELLPQNKIDFCFQCGKYPCDRLKRFDQRYRRRYGVSPIQNLEEIRRKGPAAFVREQQKKNSCSNCGRTISVHNKKCFSCDKINSWKD